MLSILDDSSDPANLDGLESFQNADGGGGLPAWILGPLVVLAGVVFLFMPIGGFILLALLFICFVLLRISRQIRG